MHNTNGLFPCRLIWQWRPMPQSLRHQDLLTFLSHIFPIDRNAWPAIGPPSTGPVNTPVAKNTFDLSRGTKIGDGCKWLLPMAVPVDNQRKGQDCSFQAAYQELVENNPLTSEKESYFSLTTLHLWQEILGAKGCSSQQPWKVQGDFLPRSLQRTYQWCESQLSESNISGGKWCI